jgi:DNA-binding transcriptional ArsR family regulator
MEVNDQAKEELHIEPLKLKKAALIFRALNHTLRQRIISLIHENGRTTVTQLYVQLRLDQSITSQHLAVLRRAGLVNAERDGKYIFYSINYQQLHHVQKIAENLANLKK